MKQCLLLSSMVQPAYWPLAMPFIDISQFQRRMISCCCVDVDFFSLLKISGKYCIGRKTVS